MFSEVEPEIHGFLEFLDLSAALQQRCPKWVLKGVCRQIFALYFFQSSPPLGVWYLVLMLHAEDNAPHNQTLYCIVWTILSLTRGVGTPAPLSLTPGVGGVGRTLRSQQNQSTFRRVQKALRTLVILEETIRKNQFKAEHHRWRLREENQVIENLVLQ